MKKYLSVVLLVAMLAAAVVPAFAQDDGGLIIIEGNFGGDPANFLPVLATDTTSLRISAFLYPGFLNVDVSTASISAYAPPFSTGGLVESWELDETGTIYTFKLREGLTWSDGDPIDSADVLYTWNVINACAAGECDSSAILMIDPTGESGVLDVVAIDAYTVQVTMASPECTSLRVAGSLNPMPSHILPEVFGDIELSPENLNPTVTRGVFNFSALNPSEQVALVANPDYSDAPDGVRPAGYIYRVVPDANVLVEQFLAGETNLIDGPAVARRADIRAAGDAGTAQVYPFPGNVFDYFAMNLADPSNPLNGLDADGNAIDQGNHPIFGDLRVREAISKAIDVDAIADAALFGEGSRMTSFVIPTSWAYASELPPIAFDPEAAAAMLEEAGWVDADGNGIREAAGAMYAEDGTPLQFTLYTNEGNTRRTAIGTLIQDQLSQIGIQVDFQTIDFNTLLDIQNSQTYDSIILGWRRGYPDDPDATQLFTPATDVVGSGSNFTSWNNAEFNELNLQAKNVPGCAPEDRAPLYIQMQEIFQNDLPYVPLFTQNGMYAASADVEGFGPYPSALFWNVAAWDLATP